MSFFSAKRALQGLLLSLFVLCLNLSAYAQSASSLTTAKNYEDDGLYEKAVPIYEEHYGKDPTNIVVLDKLKNAYRVLGRYDALIRVLERQAAEDSLNITLLSELADANYRSRNIPRAQSIVQRIIAGNPDSETTYRLTASILMGNRRFEELEKLYLLARKNLRDEKLFINEMAALMSYQGLYYQAVKELLRYYRFNPNNLEYVKNQALQFPDNNTDNRAVIRAIQEDLMINANDPALRKFLIEILFRNEEYDAAFEQSKILDEKKGKTGAEILHFANMTFDNKNYRIAQKAYEYFLSLYPRTPQAEMGIAKCFEGMGFGASWQTDVPDSSEFTGKISETYYSDKAISAYQELINKYPETEWSAEANFHIGDIRLKKFFDIQEAQNNFKKVIESKSPYRIESMFRLGECYLIEGDLSKSLDQHNTILKETRDPGIRERANFCSAELYFYLQSFDSCQRRMSRISHNRDGLFVNDALSYQLLIQENHKDQELLKQYSKGDLLFRQKKYSEAMALMSEVIRSAPEAPIVDDALFKTGEIHAAGGNYVQAIAVFRNIVDHMKNSPLADLSLKRIGDIFDNNLGRTDEAIKAYKELLMRFPKSIYYNQARKRVREIEQPAKKTS